jgi:AraC-like DNA-binding protein
MTDKGVVSLGDLGLLTADSVTSRMGFHKLCCSADTDQFLENLTSAFYPAQLRPRRGPVAQRLPESLLNVAQLTHLTLGVVRFGTEAGIDSGAIGAYHINMPIVGAVESHCGKQKMVAVPGKAAVFTPREHTLMPWFEPHATQVCIKIPQRLLEAELEALLGHPVRSSVHFDLEFDLETGPGRSWLATLRLLLSELGDPHSLVHRSNQYCEYIERALVGGLVLAHQHEYQDELYAPQPPARPRTVQRVIQAIEEAPEEPWSLEKMARHAGVSGRRLQQGFAECLGVTPMAYVRRVRLERAHEDLSMGLPVTDTAYRWGFGNLGRFARAYQDRFGEAPSETRRRSW